MIEQYYLNQPKSHECVKLSGTEKYLLKENLLGEFYTENEKALARSNLGITPLLEELRALYQSTPIPSGSVRFGTEPTRRAYDEVLSSDAIYQALLNYYTKEQFENWLLTLDDLLDKKRDKTDSYTKEEVLACINSLRSELDERIETLSVIELNLNTSIEKMEAFIGKDAKVSIQFISHSSSGTDLKVNVSSEIVLKQIKIYVNDLLTTVSDEVCYSTYIPVHITADSNIRVVATNIFEVETILEQNVVDNYFIPEGRIYIGGASSMQELFTNDSPKDFTNRYAILLNTSSNIILMIPTALVFVRADMNGVEIPFNEPEVVNNFKVYISRNIYLAGEYTIDINS